MDAVIEAHSTLADAYTIFQSQLQQMEMKMVDLEDWARRNNIRLHGIPEDIKAPEIKEYTTQLVSYQRQKTQNCTWIEYT
ncbi:Hypothetical predicted protein, partial [Pelobates cultripes]